MCFQLIQKLLPCSDDINKGSCSQVWASTRGAAVYSTHGMNGSLCCWTASQVICEWISSFGSMLGPCKMMFFAKGDALAVSSTNFLMSYTGTPRYKGGEKNLLSTILSRSLANFWLTIKSLKTSRRGLAKTECWCQFPWQYKTNSMGCGAAGNEWVCHCRGMGNSVLAQRKPKLWNA